MDRDRIRQIVVAVSAVVAVIGALVGSGALGGTPMQNAAGGAFSDTATPIAPAGPAFSIWSVIYLGLVVYAVWQLLPRNTTASRHRMLGYWAAASMLLNSAWLAVVQLGLIVLSLPIIAALLVVLARIFVLCRTSLPTGRLDAVITDCTFGLYLGWVSIATAANATAVLVAYGFRGFGLSPDGWTVAVLAVAGVVGIVTAIAGRGRLTPALALSWGLAWVAVGRLTGDLVSQPGGIAALVAAALVLAVAVALRLRAIANPRVLVE